MIDSFLPSTPLWLAGIILVVLCVLASETGRFIHRRMVSRRGNKNDNKSDAEGYIIGAIFGLFAFIIGFTFSIAADRFDARRGWVGEEATAINSMFHRAEFLDEPFRTRLRIAIREYARTRIAPHGQWDKSMDEQVRLSHQLRQKMWDETRAGAFPYRDSDLGAYVIEGMNDAITAGLRRELEGTAHIPDRVLNALLLYLLVASGVLGFLADDRQSNRLRLASALLFVLMAIAIVLILDLDRPRAGSIQVPQTALIKLVAALDKVELTAPTDQQSE